MSALTKIAGLAALALLLLAGCSSPAKRSGGLAALRPGNLMEVNFTASVPASLAYGNILAKAYKCWSGSHRVVLIEAEPFDAVSGFARIAVETPGEILIPRMMITVIEIFPEGENAARLTGRSLKSKIRSFNPEADLPNLKLWAEGSDIPCGHQQAAAS